LQFAARHHGAFFLRVSSVFAGRSGRSFRLASRSGDAESKHLEKTIHLGSQIFAPELAGEADHLLTDRMYA
jgi:hypothetical protein